LLVQVSVLNSTVGSAFGIAIKWVQVRVLSGVGLWMLFS